MKNLKLRKIFKYYSELIKSSRWLTFCLFFLILLSLISSALEVISFRFFTQASSLLKESLVSGNLNLFIIFALVFIFSNLVRLVYLLFASKFSYKFAALIDNRAIYNLGNLFIQFNNQSKEIVEKYLTTSSMLIAPNIFLPFFLFFNSLITTFAILGYLFYLFGFQVIIIFSAIVALYYLYYRLFKLISNSTKNISKLLSKRNSILLDMKFNFIELLSLNLSRSLYEQFRSSQNNLRKTEALINFNSFSPRYFIEICVILVSMSIFLFSKDLNITKLILFGSSYGYAFLRLLPFVQTTYGSLNTFFSFFELIRESVFILSLKSRSVPIYKANIIKNESDKLIEIKDFSFLREGKKIFKPINFQFRSNAIYSVSGPSGIGKSSLINYFSLGRSLLPSIGEINLFYNPKDNNNYIKYSKNENIEVISMGQFSRFRSGNLYTVLFDYVLNLGLYDKEDLFSNKKLRKIVNECITTLKIDFISKDSNPFIDSASFSGGQSQRICMARSLISALILKPKLLIWDEPFSSLDKELGTNIFNNLINLNFGFSIIMVSHLTLTSSSKRFYDFKLEPNK